MIILRNQTLSIFDISKRKTIIDFSNYGYFKKATIPFFVAASFFDLSIKERGHREIKKSIYNYCHKRNQYTLLWNTASDACVLLDINEATYFEGTETTQINSDFLSLLYDLGFFVDADLDEVFRINLLRKKHAYAYPEDKHIDVEILPTQTCNARCFYCFEQKYNSLTMNTETIEAVISYLCSRVTQESNVCFIWFGGEPLFGEEIIDQILAGVNKYFHGQLPYYSSITTNNSLLTSEMFCKFKGTWNVRDVLTTIDGFREEHNRRKAYVSQSFDAYTTTIKNLRNLVRAEIRTTCRINLDKDNAGQLDRILDDLMEFSQHSNFNVQITTLRNKTKQENSRNKYYAAEEYSAFYHEMIPKLFERGFVQNPLSQLPSRDSSNCIACALNKIVINANGKLFRCVQDSLSDKNSVGDCVNGIRGNWNYSKWYYEIDNLGESCEKCVFLPCCQGGCKYYRLSPSFDTTPCFRKKFYIDYIADQIIRKYSKEIKECPI